MSDEATDIRSRPRNFGRRLRAGSKAFLHWLGYYAGGLYDRLDRHHAFLLASGLSFSLIFCIIPLMLIVFSLLGHFLESEAIAAQIDSFINRAIPYPEQATYAKELIFSRVAEFTGYKRVAGAIGMIGLFFAASGLFSAMRTALNTVFRVRTSESVSYTHLTLPTN